MGMGKLLKDLAEKEREERDNQKGTGKPGRNYGKSLYSAYPLLGLLLLLSAFGCSFLASPLWVSPDTFLKEDPEGTPLAHG